VQEVGSNRQTPSAVETSENEFVVTLQ